MSEPSIPLSGKPPAKARLSRSERQHGKPSAPIHEQRARILAALAKRKGDSLPMSAMAYAAFPDYTFRSPQGAALAVSRTVRGLYEDKLIRGASYGYEITDAGMKAAQEQHQLQERGVQEE